MRRFGRAVFIVGLVLTAGLIGLFVVSAGFMNHSFFLPIYWLPILALVTLIIALLGFIVFLLAKDRK